MSGIDYKLTNSITLHHPTLQEILSINNGIDSENIYWLYVQALMCDPYSNMVMLDDMGKNFMEVTPFEIFIIKWKQLNALNLFKSALNFFIVEDHDFALSHYENGCPCLYDINDNKCQINAEIFEYIYEWLKGINKIEYLNRIKPEDENARRILIEDARDEMKKAKKRKKAMEEDADFLGTLMSATCFGGNGAITPFNINQCKIFWVFEGFSIEQKKTNVSHILDGIYHGTISSKDINKKELDWTK